MISTKDIIIAFIIGFVGCVAIELAFSALANMFSAALVLVQ